MSEPDYKTIFYELVASLTLADHLGDAAEDVEKALSKARDTEAVEASRDGDGDNWGSLQQLLHRRRVTTLNGTKIGDE